MRKLEPTRMKLSALSMGQSARVWTKEISGQGRVAMEQNVGLGAVLPEAGCSLWSVCGAADDLACDGALGDAKRLVDKWSHGV